ncbi:MAG TPA: glycosyltransferase 87 family protein [bacterium]|nr:glycosyltransferase 87 family protein [bacterium]
MTPTPAGSAPVADPAPAEVPVRPAAAGGGAAMREALALFIGGALWLMYYPGNPLPPDVTPAGATALLLLRGSAPLWWWKSLGMLLLIAGWLTAYQRGGGRRGRAVLILLFAGWALLLPTLAEMALRQRTQPHYYAHDGGVLQLEAAADFLRAGVNPYAADYRMTPLGRFSGMAMPGGHPALDHCVYPPASFLLLVPLRALAPAADARLLSLLLVALVAVVLAREASLLPLIGWVANPLLNFYLVRGTNDHLMLAVMVLGVLAARTGRWRLAGGLLGLAGMIKPFAWTVALLLLAGQRDRRVWRAAGGAWLLTTLALLLPFVFWSPLALYDDLLAYPLGWSAVSYPVELIGNYGSGALWHGLPPAGARLLAAAGALATLALLGALIRRRWRAGGILPALADAALLLTVAGWSGRFLHDNYLGVFALLAWWGLTLPERCGTLTDADMR